MERVASSLLGSMLWHRFVFFIFFVFMESVIAALIKAKRMFPQRNDALSL